MPVIGQTVTDRYALYHGDCVEVVGDLPDNSVGFSVFSPPFADLYAYSDHDEDMGNCKTYDEFFRHWSFLVRQLYRVMMPGRVVAVHCMDLPTFKSKGEEIGMKDFSGDIVRLFTRLKGNEFLYHSRHCIWKDPLEAAFRTKAIGLAHKQLVKDSSMCRTGMPDYVLAFRKPGDNPEPITHPEGLTRYVGERQVPRDLDRYLGGVNPLTNEPWLPKANKRSHWIWQQYASPVWFDIRNTRVLPFREAREPDDQRHICPLQLDVIDRCLVLWSNPGDTVLSPFAGVGSEVYTAVECGRKGVGVELKKTYYRQMVRNLQTLDTRQKIRTGFSNNGHG